MTIHWSAAAAALSALAMLCGCGTDYAWRPSVPSGMRTVAVPTFRNESDLQEAGAMASRQLLREFQREGTFAIRRTGNSSLEVQGVIVKASRDPAAFNRGYGSRASEYRYTVTAEVSLINKDTGKVLLNNRRYVAETTFLTRGDLLTTQRDAAARIAQEFARQIVDDVTSFDYGKPGK